MVTPRWPPIAENKRNGTRTKIVRTEIGPVEIEVPRDRDGSFEPVIVPKLKRRLGGIGQILLSLTVRGLRTGEITVHFDEVHGAKVSKRTISRVTEKVTGELAEWSSRPLDALYPAFFRRYSRSLGGYSCRIQRRHLHRWSRPVRSLRRTRVETSVELPLNSSPSTVCQRS